MWYFVACPEGEKKITLRTSFESDIAYLRSQDMKNMPPHEEWSKLLQHFWNQAFPSDDTEDSMYFFLAYLFLSPICYLLGRDEKRRTAGKVAETDELARETKRRSEFSTANLDHSSFSWVNDLVNVLEVNSGLTSGSDLHSKCS